jgi:hypothetical protein
MDIEIVETNISNNNDEYNIDELLNITSYTDSDTNIDKTHNNFNSYSQYNYDELIAEQINYNENYTKKMLLHIAKYYDLPKKVLKQNKDLLVESIVMFENDINNAVIVFQRKHSWECLNVLKDDPYLSKFIMFDYK